MYLDIYRYYSSQVPVHRRRRPSTGQLIHERPHLTFFYHSTAELPTSTATSNSVDTSTRGNGDEAPQCRGTACCPQESSTLADISAARSLEGQMSALDDDTALATVYESSATLYSTSESTSLYSSNNGDVMAGPPSVATNPESMTSKSKAPGVRQRITVVCAECKRLKLRCDRRTPCNQCLKRDMVDKCIYHQAATEKIDLQSLNNRILTLEHKTSTISAASVPNGRPSNSINPGAAASAKHRYAFSGDSGETSSTLLALGAHGASVAINLDGPTGLWIDDLGFDMSTGDAPSNGEKSSETSGISLQPVTSIPDAGLLDFLSTFTQYFRLPSSSSGTSADDEFNLPDDDGARIGVTPRAVFKLPPAHIRAQIYPRLEAAHIMAPCVNYIQFRRRMEGMFRWAEIASGLGAGDSGAASLHGDDNDIEPLRSPPTLSFYAAAAAALAMGAQCWLFERNLGYCSEGSTTTAPSGTSGHASPTPASGTASSNMPPPISASEGYNRCDAGIGTVPPVMISDALPYTLFRIAKLALFLNTERAGYQSLDLDYVYAKTVLARLFLLAHSGPTDNDYSLLTSSPTRKAARPRKSTKGKGRGSAGPTASSASGVDSSMSEDTGSGSSRNAKVGPKDSDRLPTLALDPELIGLVGEVVSNARLMGLSTDPDIAGGNKLSLYEKEMRRRLWWEVVSIDSFVSDCVGQHPLIHLQECSTRLPADVDEELFDPSSMNLPSPNIESMHGNIEYYIRKLRLLRINKDVKKRMESIKNLNPEMSASDLLTHLSPILEDFNDWLADLPDYLQLKDVPSPITQSFASMNMNDMSHSSRTPSSPDEMSLMSPTSNENPGGFSDRESPFVISMRCDLIISANYSMLKAMLPLVKNTGDRKSGKIDKFHCLHLMEPATTIIATWTHLHSVFKHIRPSMFMCYSFTRNLFDSSVTLAHLAIIQPMIAASAMPPLECAIEVLKDPSVLTGHLSAANKDNYPSEAVRIVGALIQKIHDARRGPGITGSKRKHEDIDASIIHLTNFRLPYVGAGVICTAPPPSGSAGSGATFVVPQNPPDSTSNGSNASRKTKDSAQNRTARVKKSSVSKDAPPAPVDAEQGPPTAKQKTTQNGQVTVRRRVAKKSDAGRARAGSTTAGSGVERAPSIAAPSAPPAPPAPVIQPPPTPQAQPIVPTHSHHGQQQVSPATAVYYPQAPPVPSQPVDNFTMQPHTASSPDFVAAAGYRSDSMYPTTMATYPHPQAYADHHRGPLRVTVPSQVQHGQVNYDGFQGSSSAAVAAAQVRSHQSFPTSANPMDYSVAAQHQSELDMLVHPSRSEAHYQGRGSIDHGQPSGQPVVQPHQYHQQMQVPQTMTPREQESQPWSDSSTYHSWSYPS